MNFQSLVRTGAEKGLLLNSWDHWKKYRKSRGATNHVYDESITEEVFRGIPDFLREAGFLIDQVKQRQSYI
ncbi:MAG: nucleotidyltransferase substrate binding protein [Candidatus Caenarcaniphilales bacterium]|nr:nucleotidyltransferase substrate binding protein [Candidatus Caenarcaniphilales bacterium]